MKLIYQGACCICFCVPFLASFSTAKALAWHRTWFKVLVTQLCLALCDSARLPSPWDSPGKNTEVGCHFLLQESLREPLPSWCEPPCHLPSSFMLFLAWKEYLFRKWSSHLMAMKQETTLGRGMGILKNQFF